MHFGDAGGIVLKINLIELPEAVTCVGGSAKEAKNCEAKCEKPYLRKCNKSIWDQAVPANTMWFIEVRFEQKLHFY